MPIESLDSILSKKEPLNPELTPYLQTGPLGIALFHPLFYQIIYDETMNAFINHSFNQKKLAQLIARKTKAWGSYVFLYERPYRLQGFLEIRLALNDKEYWSLLGDVYTDSDNIWQNFDVWVKLLSSNRRFTKEFTGKEDRSFFNKLPEEMTIYRGYQRGKNKKGLSFTLSKDKAIWFSARYSKTGAVFELVVNKKQTFAYTNCRNEQEIILKPKFLTLIK